MFKNSYPSLLLDMFNHPNLENNFIKILISRSHLGKGSSRL
jgi:hypothetical protein